MAERLQSYKVEDEQTETSVAEVDAKRNRFPCSIVWGPLPVLTYVCMYVYMYVCMYTCMYVCMYV